MNPVVDETGSITIGSRCRSPDEAQRNPGTINKLHRRPGLRFAPSGLRLEDPIVMKPDTTTGFI
jgi:hypothetical protein